MDGDELEGSVTETGIATDALIAALDALDVPFLRGDAQDKTERAMTAEALFVGLAESREARVRSAIIPLLLRHPELAAEARAAAAHLKGEPQETLELFYTAATLLQRKFATRLKRLFGAQPRLPDYFSRDLGIVLSEDVETALTQVADENRIRRRLDLNWVATYERAAETWLKHVELQVERGERRLWQTA